MCAAKTGLKELGKMLLNASAPGKTTGKTKRSATPKRNQPSKKGGRRSKSTGNTVRSHRDMINRFSPVVQRLNSLKKTAALSKANYFDKDTKFDAGKLADDMAQTQREFDLLRATMRSGLGDRPIRMRLSTPFTITTTVTTGVTKAVSVNGSGLGTLDPVQCTEWATMLALFDEYKVHGGECVFNYINAQQAVGTAIDSNSIPVIGYDGGAAGASATSSIALTQLSEHKVLNVWNNGSSVPVLHRFGWHTPHGTVEAASGSNGLPTDAWMLTDNPSNCGTIQFYHVGQLITAIASGAGIIYFDFEFRCRQ